MGESDRSKHAAVLNDVCARVLVSGRVQGVFFRYTCAREAASVGLRGTVRNLVDGRVEALFQGPKPDVERLIAWCHEGPPAARVTDVSVAWETIDASLPPF
jgi:acylphosphatase